MTCLNVLCLVEIVIILNDLTRRGFVNVRSAGVWEDMSFLHC